MHRNLKLIISSFLLLIFSQSFAEVVHRDGYSYTDTGKTLKLDTDEEYIEKFTKAFGRKIDTFSDRRLAPRIWESEGKPITYIFRDPGKPRGDNPARRTTTLTAFNQVVPQAVKDLAIAEFGATPEDFKAFPIGFRFTIAERRPGKFYASFYTFRKDSKRDGSLATINMGDDSMLTMPKGVFKVVTKSRSKVKGVYYSLFGPGKVEAMTAELIKSFKEAGFETQVKNNAKSNNILFKKGKVDGKASLTKTSSKETHVNLLINVKSGRCHNKYGELNALSVDDTNECS